MAHVKVDRVQQTTQSTGTGALVFDGVIPTRMRSFASAMANGSDCWVLIEHQSAAEWEISLATYNAGSITRTFASGSVSTTGGLVPFSVGVKTVSVIAPAGATPITDGAGNMSVPGILSAGGYVESRNPTPEMRLSRSDNGKGWAVFNWSAGSDALAIGYLTGGAWAGNVMFIGRDGAISVPNVATTASGANAVLDSGAGNNLLRSTSSLIYKRDIEDIESARADTVVEQARAVWYRSKAPGDPEDWSWYGLIAEELAEIEPRLVFFGYQEQHYELVEVVPATEDEPARMERRLKEGAEKVPDGIAYDRLTVMLLDVARREKAKVAALTDEVADLKARLTAVEEAVAALQGA